MKLNELAIDTDRVENGAVVKDIPGLPGVEFKVRGFESDAATRLRDRLVEALPADQKDGDGKPNDAASKRIFNAILAEAVLQGWNLQKPNGEPLDFSAELAAKLIPDPRFARIRNGVIHAASIVGQNPAMSLADVLGN